MNSNDRTGTTEKNGENMRLRNRPEIQAYRGHAIERLEQDSEFSEIPEEHGTGTFYECGISLIEVKEGC